MYEFAYFTWSLLFAPVWLGIFFARRDFRKEMLQLGVLFGAMGPLSEWFWFLKDYWDPTRTVPLPLFGIQGFAYVFIVTGSVVFAYPTLFKKPYVAIQWHMVVLLLVLAVIPLIVLTNIFRMPSIYGMFAGQALVAAYLFVRNRWLIRVLLFNFLYGAGLGTLIFFIMIHLYPGMVGAWWKMGTPQIAGMPVYEIVWLGFIGLGLGSVLEFMEKTHR